MRNSNSQAKSFRDASESILQAASDIRDAFAALKGALNRAATVQADMSDEECLATIASMQRYVAKHEGIARVVETSFDEIAGTLDALAEECECQGHPAGPFDPMGQTVYCDGTCRH